MKYLLPLFDISVNKIATKIFMKQKFSDWFTRQITIGLGNGQELDDVKFDYRLSVLKPRNAKWLISLYDYMISPEGKLKFAMDGDVFTM